MEKDLRERAEEKVFTFSSSKRVTHCQTLQEFPLSQKIRGIVGKNMAKFSTFHLTSAEKIKLSGKRPLGFLANSIIEQEYEKKVFFIQQLRNIFETRTNSDFRLQF